MRAFQSWALPFLALAFAPAALVPSAVAQTDPVITGEPPSAQPAPEAKPPVPATPPAKSEARPRAARSALPKPPPGIPLTEADPRTKAERLDALFAELKRQSTHARAAETAAKIEEEWGDSGSATVDLMLFRAGQAMAKDDKAAALDFVEQALILKPDYAEAWNRRATLNYVASDYGKSLADIEQTLRLEPRHWGALMGLGMILEETDRKQFALDTYMRVLDVYPAMKGAQDAVARLSDELSGQSL